MRDWRGSSAGSYGSGPLEDEIAHDCLRRIRSAASVTPGKLPSRVVQSRGADLWFEKKLMKKIFMSGRLHDAILAAKVKTNFHFAQARIIDAAGS